MIVFVAQSMIGGSFKRIYPFTLALAQIWKPDDLLVLAKVLQDVFC